MSDDGDKKLVIGLKAKAPRVTRNESDVNGESYAREPSALSCSNGDSFSSCACRSLSYKRESSVDLLDVIFRLVEAAPWSRPRRNSPQDIIKHTEVSFSTQVLLVRCLPFSSSRLMRALFLVNHRYGPPANSQARPRERGRTPAKDQPERREGDPDRAHGEGDVAEGPRSEGE